MLKDSSSAGKSDLTGRLMKTVWRTVLRSEHPLEQITGMGARQLPLRSSKYWTLHVVENGMLMRAR